jgi:CheY-like chemotaxis protein
MLLFSAVTGNKAKVKEVNKNLEVVLVDDDDDDCHVFREAVEAIFPGFRITLYDSGEPLLSRLADPAQPRPDVVFLDINMPAVSGLDVLTHVRSNPELSQLPILVYSTSAYIGQINSAFQKGASLYIQKPATMQGIRNMLKSVLSRPMSDYALQPDKSKFVFGSG